MQRNEKGKPLPKFYALYEEYEAELFKIIDKALDGMFSEYEAAFSKTSINVRPSEMTLAEIYRWVGKEYDKDNPYLHGVAEPPEVVELVSLVIRYGKENYIEGKRTVVKSIT